jgi:hypothetical protein
MSASSRPTTGLAVLALLAVVDFFWVVVSWSGVVGPADAPPPGALALFAVVGAVTLAAARPAQRGHRAAVWAVVASRVVSVLLVDVTALLLGAPVWVKAVTSVAIVLTALGIWWISPLLSRHATAGTAARATS